MSLRIALAWLGLAATGCASSTYIDDFRFLHRHTETIELMPDRTSDARVVVTALTTAGQSAESVVRVGPLPIPSQRDPLEGPAVELFVRRIRAAGGQPVDLAEQAHERHADHRRRRRGGRPGGGA